MLQRTTQIVVSFVFVVTIAGCSLLPTSNSRTPPQALSGATPTPIPTPIVPTKPVYEVKSGDVAKIIQFAGRVAPAVEEELFFGISGRIRNIYVERDDFVTAGQVLADLEIDDLERELTSALLELERASQELEEAELAHSDDLTRAQLNLQKAQAELAEAEQERLNDLEKARIELNKQQLELARLQNLNPDPERTKAEVDLANSRIEVQRAQQAYDEIAYGDELGRSSQAERLQRATLELERAEADYNLALQEIGSYDYDLALLNQDVTLAAMEVQRLQNLGDHIRLKAEEALAQLSVDILERGVDPLFKTNVARSRLNVEKLEAAIADGQLIAPFDGQVLSLSLTDGREAVAYKPVSIVANVSELEVTAEPRDSQLQDLEEGMPIKVTLSSRPGEEYAGVIRQLPYPYGGGGRPDLIDDSTDKSTRISLDSSLGELGFELGDLVRIEAEVERSDGVLWLPPQAIRTFDGRKFVVIQDGEIQRRVDVKVGVESEDRVEIEEGLEEGQIIVGL